MSETDDPPSEPSAPAQLPPATSDPGPDAWDLAGEWLLEHGALPALLLLTIGIAIIHGHVFWGEPVGDDLTFHFAESARLSDCLRAGDFDFWNPSANAGYASLYYYQSLPQLASAIPAAIFGHHLFWFELSVWLPHVLAPAAAYKGMRLIGASPWQSVVAAFAVAFMNGESRWGAGNAGTFQVGLYTQTWALAAMPLALGYCVRWLQTGKMLAPALAWSVFVTLCHPFAGGVMGFGLFISLVARAVPRLEPLGWPSIVGRALIMFGICELFLFPADWARLSFMPLGPYPAWVAYILGYGTIAGGLVLPLVVRVPGSKLVFPELGRLRVHPRVLVFEETGITGELARIAILGLGIVLGSLPFVVPLVANYSGFGGFPHRVWDEVGPGFAGLADWFKSGKLLDFGNALPDVNPQHIDRLPVLTYALPAVLLLCRSKMMRWLWPPALIYAFLLALGPHMGKIGDDLFPPVRALGAMQIVVALGIGAGAMLVGKMVWDAAPTSKTYRAARITIVTVIELLGMLVIYWSWRGSLAYKLIGILHLPIENPLPVQLGVTAAVITLTALCVFEIIPLWQALGEPYGLRTALAAAAAALCVLIIVPGAKSLAFRVNVLEDYPGSSSDEMMALNAELAKQPPGRKQTGAGAENHWWNLLSYVYNRVPSTLQMGGGGLQASPNYDFLWWTQTQLHDAYKTAWIYDAPYIVFARSQAGKIANGESIAHTEHFELRKLHSPGLVTPVHVVGQLQPNLKPATINTVFVHMYVDTIGTLPPGYRTHGDDLKIDLGHLAALEWLRGEQPMHDEVIAYQGSGPPGPPPDGRLLRAWHQDSPGDAPDIVAEVEARSPTTFVVRESWNPQWRAFLDGEPVTIRRVTPDFPAIDVPAGKHTIALRFERPWWTLASWLAWPGVAVGAWLLTRKRKPKPQPAAS